MMLKKNSIDSTSSTSSTCILLLGFFGRLEQELLDDLLYLLLGIETHQYLGLAVHRDVEHLRDAGYVKQSGQARVRARYPPYKK